MKKAFIFVSAIVLAGFMLTSCGGKKQPKMSPKTTEVSGDLNGYFEVVEKEIKATEGFNAVWNVELRRTDKPLPWDKSTTLVKFNDYCYPDENKCKVGFGIETFDKDDNMINKHSANSNILLSVRSDDFLDLMKLSPGETGIIRWDVRNEEKEVKGKLTFKISSAYEMNQSKTETSSSSSANDWDKLLDTYESYVKKYSACMKKVAAGDASALSEYASLLEKAEELGTRLEKASGQMTAKQVKRYAKINAMMVG